MTIISATTTTAPAATAMAAPYSAAGPLIAGTSLTPIVIDTVNIKTFKIEEYNRSFFVGARLRCTAIGFTNVWLEGVVTAWDGENVSIDGDLASGAGSYSYWGINVAGQPGVQGPIGSTGPTGPSGGPAGPAGATGPQGSVWRNGSGAPANSLGVDGDYYLDDVTNNFWRRSASVYTVAGNLGGPPGPAGPPGPTGPQGLIADAPSDGNYYSRRNAAWAFSPGGGNVSNSGTPNPGQLAQFVNATTIGGVDLDPDLVAIAALTGTNTIYYRSAANTWTAVTFGANLSFTGGVLALSGNFLARDATANISVGYTFTAFNGGTVSSGTFTPAPANGNYQYYTNNGAHTLAAPTTDCAIDVLVTNGTTAGSITFSGFTVGSTGDALTTTNTQKFIISIRRINAVATYAIKALQ